MAGFLADTVTTGLTNAGTSTAESGSGSGSGSGSFDRATKSVAALSEGVTLAMEDGEKLFIPAGDEVGRTRYAAHSASGIEIHEDRSNTANARISDRSQSPSCPVIGPTGPDAHAGIISPQE